MKGWKRVSESFRVSILSSGSAGNSLYIESDKQKLLIDAGLSGKKIEALLNKIDRSAKDLDSILVTHEHKDHIQGVGVLARRYGIDVYANQKTWKRMEPLIGEVPLEHKHLFETETTKTLGDLDVESFGVSHDSVAPQFYRIHKDHKSFVDLTDTGYVNERLKGQIEGADAYLLETNHDIDMLMSGPYPWNLKQRILGDYGHLSNEDSADLMTQIVKDNTKRIYLGHRSHDNNQKDLAHMVAKQTLHQNDISTLRCQLIDTDVEQPTPLYHI